jgi:hypothetical protein
MRCSNLRRGLMVLSTVALGLGCGKKDDDDKKSKKTASDYSTPAATAEESMTALSSAGLLLGDANLSLLEGELNFEASDCSEHAEGLARSGDGSEHTDNSGRLRMSHPRAPIQDVYCKMTKDTGAPDSFLGAISGNKMLFCFIGDDYQFDGVPRTRSLTSEEVDACLSDLDEEQMAEIKEQLGDDVEVVVTASSPPAFGDKDDWDASIELGIEIDGVESGLKMLLKDSDGILGMAVNNGAGRDINVDAYTVLLNKTEGTAFFEAKFQRIRTPDGTTSNGWNRHILAKVVGEIDETGEFGEVTEVQSIYSDISTNPAGDNGAQNEDDPVQMGTIYSVGGLFEEGIVSYAYDLTCTYNNTSYDCQNPNSVSSWAATSGSGACNAALSGTTCEGDGLPLESNDDTAFAMAIDHDDFLASEDWFADLKTPAEPTVEYRP